MGSFDTHADLVAALAKGVMSCECEHINHDRPAVHVPCGPALYERRTAYGNFVICEACFDLGHMPEAESAFDPDDDMPETVGIR